jgi:hypothetical protein
VIVRELQLAAIGTGLVLLATSCAHPPLTLRAWPGIPLAGRPVTLYAELHGPEEERFYCAELAWLWPNGTESTHQEDCTPFLERDAYDRRWSVRLRGLPTGVWRFGVALRRSGRDVAAAHLDLEVR